MAAGKAHPRKMHGSVLYAMLRSVRSGLAVRFRGGLEAEFEIAQCHDAVDGAPARRRGEDLRGDLAQAVDLLF